MQLTFDPMIAGEAKAVRKMLDALSGETVRKLPDVVAEAVRSEPAGAVTVEPVTPLAPSVPAAPSTADVTESAIAPGVLEGFAQVPPSVIAPPAVSAPTSVAPSASAVTASPAGVEVDKGGFPWDARIHSESKAKVADGTWRKRRNTAPEVVAQVEAELRARMGAAPLAPAAGVVPAIPAAPSVAPEVPPPPVLETPRVAEVVAIPPIPAPATSAQVSAPTPLPPPVPAAAPTAPAVTAPVTGGEAVTFGSIINEVNRYMQAGATNEHLDAALALVGVDKGKFVTLNSKGADTMARFIQAFRELAAQAGVRLG